MYRYVKMTTRMSTALQDDLGWGKSPEIPSLSNGVDAAPPLLVVVGGIAFYKHVALVRAMTSQCPDVSYYS